MDYFSSKSLSKYLITDTIDFNKHAHNIDIFINDKWRKYVGSDIGRLFKITRWLELLFWPTRKQSQPSQGDFFARITLQHEPWLSEMGTCSGIGGNLIFIYPTLFTFPSMTYHRIKSVVSYKICIITKHWRINMIINVFQWKLSQLNLE